jgi:hypothetical protein
VDRGLRLRALSEDSLENSAIGPLGDSAWGFFSIEKHIPAADLFTNEIRLREDWKTRPGGLGLGFFSLEKHIAAADLFTMQTPTPSLRFSAQTSTPDKRLHSLTRHGLRQRHFPNESSSVQGM